MAPDVIAQRDDVGTGRENLVGQLRCEPHPVGGVLAVDDAEVGAELFAQAAEPSLDRSPARRPEDVSYEEDLQGDASPLAARTSMWTCWPLSCV
jgi:hypothetical protein